jgi:hypothetical protein
VALRVVLLDGDGWAACVWTVGDGGLGGRNNSVYITFLCGD